MPHLVLGACFPPAKLLLGQNAPQAVRTEGAKHDCCAGQQGACQDNPAILHASQNRTIAAIMVTAATPASQSRTNQASRFQSGA